MNDFVRNVVEEILSGIEREPKQLSRPNYQKDLAGKRLKVYDLPPIGTQPFTQAENKGTYADEYSSIRQLSLSREITAGITAGINKRVEIKKSQEIPIKASDITLEFIEKVDKRVVSMLGLQYFREGPLGLAYCEECRVSQLFIVEKVLKKFPDIQAEVVWSDKTGGVFMLQIAGSSEKVKLALADFGEEFQKNESKRNEILFSDSPSYLLQKQLKIASNRPVAAIEGIRFMEAVKLINSYYIENRESVIECMPGRNFILAQGDTSEIKIVLQSFLTRLNV